MSLLPQSPGAQMSIRYAGVYQNCFVFSRFVLGMNCHISLPFLIKGGRWTLWKRTLLVSHCGALVMLETGIRIKLPIFLKSPLSDFFFFNVLGYQDLSYFVCSL